MLVIVILTPGTGAPEESVTVPSIVPDVTCAAEGKPKISHASKAKNGLQENSEMSRETFMVCAPFAKRKPGLTSFEGGLIGLFAFWLFPPIPSSSTPYILAAALGRLGWDIFRWTCIFPQRTSSSSIRRGFKGRGFLRSRMLVRSLRWV